MLLTITPTHAPRDAWLFIAVYGNIDSDIITKRFGCSFDYNICH